MMQKPITIRYNELVESLCKDISDSQLPAFVILYVLRDLIGKVQEDAARQIQADEDTYKKAVEEAGEKAESEVRDVNMG